MPKRLPEFKLIAVPVTEEAAQMAGFKYAAPDIGTRHKIGGSPDFLQSGSIPRCGSCNTEMSFYAQLDSIGDELVIADCGMIYVFCCFWCFDVKAFVDSC